MSMHLMRVEMLNGGLALPARFHAVPCGFPPIHQTICVPQLQHSDVAYALSGIS